MSKREELERGIKCDKCGQSGLATISELENPVFSGGRAGLKVEGVSEGFSHRGNAISCNACGVVIVTIPSE